MTENVVESLEMVRSGKERQRPLFAAGLAVLLSAIFEKASIEQLR